MDEPLRRLEIRLPADHPVFAILPGKRSQIIREWLDIGQRLMRVEELLASTQDTTTFSEKESLDKAEFLSFFK
jgi:hypothetical protein